MSIPCEPYEIIHAVHDAYKGICKKLGLLTGKSDEIYKSHGREPKSRNPVASSNTSPATHYVTYVRQYEAVQPGAGVLLNNRIHAALDAEFLSDTEIVPQAKCHVSIIEERSDVDKWLAQFDMDKATSAQLRHFETECRENIDALQAAEAQARARRRVLDCVRQTRVG